MIDQAIANAEISLQEKSDGGMTNAITFLVRPERYVSDASGDNPGETFIEVTLTREEVREVLNDLDRDWADHEKFVMRLPA